MKQHRILNLLQDKLSAEELKQVYKSYDVIGDTVIIRMPEKLQNRADIIADALMKTHKQVKTIWRQSSAVGGEFRLRNLEHVAGEKRSETTYTEHDCVFRMDLKTCYFSPRLSHERIRIARLVKQKEVVVNMFAGVGTFSIVIAKHSASEKVYSIDVNPIAYEYMKENVLLNRIWNRVIPMQGDAKAVIMEKLRGSADRVLMPLPELANEYLDCAVMALKPDGGWIHYYDFEHAEKGEDAAEKARRKAAEKLLRLNVAYVSSGRVVRDVGPRWQQIVLDIEVRGKT